MHFCVCVHVGENERSVLKQPLCIHICTFTYVRVTYIYIYIYACVFIDLRMYVCIYVGGHDRCVLRQPREASLRHSRPHQRCLQQTHPGILTHTYTLTHTHTHTHTHAYTHTCIHTCIHTCMHACMHTNTLSTT